jgi:hypothetical protein
LAASSLTSRALFQGNFDILKVLREEVALQGVVKSISAGELAELLL